MRYAFMEKSKKIYNKLKVDFTLDNICITAMNLISAPLLESIPRHYHGENSYEIHYIPSGSSRVNISGNLYRIAPNTLYVTGPFIEHEQYCDYDTSNLDNASIEYSIYFLFSEFSLALPEDSIVRKFMDVTMWFGQDTQGLQLVLDQIFFEMERKQIGYREHIQTLLAQCIIKTVRNYEHGSSDWNIEFPTRRIIDSKSLITEESFLYDYNVLTLDTLAYRLGLSRRQTDRFLKATYNKTFLEMKQDARMAAAQQMLREKDDSIESIASQLNYSSTQHFYSVFKKFFQISPGEYRASFKELQDV